MPNYEICYRDAAGAPLGTLCAPCAGDKEAKILAHAMRLAGTKRIEVWKGATLVYARPEPVRAAAIEALRPRAAAHCAK